MGHRLSYSLLIHWPSAKGRIAEKDSGLLEHKKFELGLWELSKWLHQDTLVEINKVKLSGDVNHADRFVWNQSTKGQFETKQAYNLLCGFTDNSDVQK